MFRLPGNRDATKPDYSGITAAYPNIQVIPFNQNGVGCVIFVNTDTTPLASGGTSTSVNIVIPVETWQVNYGETTYDATSIRNGGDTHWFYVENLGSSPVSITATEEVDESWMDFATNTVTVDSAGYDFIGLNVECPDALTTLSGSVTFADTDGKTQTIAVNVQCVNPPPCSGRYCRTEPSAIFNVAGQLIPFGQQPVLEHAKVVEYDYTGEGNCRDYTVKPSVEIYVEYYPPTDDIYSQPGPLTGIEGVFDEPTLTGSGYNATWVYSVRTGKLDEGSYVINAGGFARTFTIEKVTEKIPCP